MSMIRYVVVGLGIEPPAPALQVYMTLHSLLSKRTQYIYFFTDVFAGICLTLIPKKVTLVKILTQMSRSQSPRLPPCMFLGGT